MAKINFNVTTAPKKKQSTPKPVKIELTQHITPVQTNEAYVYIDENGEEKKYVGILTKSNHAAFGKIYDEHKVDLIYHPEVKHVDAVKEYFTYIDENNEEQVFKGKVEFDLERNTYIGVIQKRDIKEKMIQIFEEKNNN